MLVVDNVSKRFAGVAAVAGASLKVATARIRRTGGPNGSGKSTLLNLITGFEKAGRRSGDPQRRAHLRQTTLGHRRARSASHLSARRTANAAQRHGTDVARRQPQSWGNGACQHLYTAPGAYRGTRGDRPARALLTRLQLDQLADHPGGKLSGGQQKLLALGMVLMSQPQVVLLDEPTAGVNPALRVRLAEHLRQLQSEGLTILVVEHDMRFVADTCDRVYVLDKGTVLTTCAPSELASNPEVLEAYLGKAGTDAAQPRQQPEGGLRQ